MVAIWGGKKWWNFGQILNSMLYNWNPLKVLYASHQWVGCISQVREISWHWLLGSQPCNDASELGDTSKEGSGNVLFLYLCNDHRCIQLVRSHQITLMILALFLYVFYTSTTTKRRAHSRKKRLKRLENALVIPLSCLIAAGWCRWLWTFGHLAFQPPEKLSLLRVSYLQRR